MSRIRQVDSRANQKQRTRAALVTAAAELLRQGSSPTVAEAAERARVSRATAYRYFPTQESLLIEVADVTPAVASVDELLGSLPADDPEKRLVTLVDTLNRIVVTEEVRMRTALRVYLETWLANRRKGGGTAPPVRAGRRLGWLDRALEPARKELTRREWRRLRSALALTLSIDALVVMKDVCHLDDDEALGTLRWAATSLLRSALADARG
jgi:AcrR family transcriptional regulator